LTSDTDDSGFPQNLSETNFFVDLSDRSPQSGVVPDTPNIRFWSDFADKTRWMLIKNTADTTGYSKDGIWTFPEGAIWAKHFDYPTRWETFNRLIGGNFTVWLTNSNPNDGNDFYRATIRTGGTNISIDLPGLGNRGILVDTSTDLQNWMPWMVPGNDGIPLNPDAVHTLTGPITGPRGFFRFAIEEK
jgi:hypothetical protein